MKRIGELRRCRWLACLAHADRQVLSEQGGTAGGWQVDRVCLWLWGIDRGRIVRHGPRVECNGSECWAALAATVGDRQGLVVLTHDLEPLLDGSDLPLCLAAGAWRFADSPVLQRDSAEAPDRGVRSPLLYLSRGAAMMGLVRGKARETVQVVDIRNFGLDGLAAVYDLLDEAERGRYRPAPGLEHQPGDLDAAVALLARAAGSILAAVEEEAGAALHWSASGSAMQLFRTTRACEAVVRTEDPACRYHEIQAAQGGLIAAWYEGSYRGRCHYVDVRSMYPHCVLSGRLPVRLRRSVAGPVPWTEIDADPRWYLIARAYGRWLPGEARPDGTSRADYPAGSFTAYVHDDSFRAAFRDGRIEEVYWLGQYETGDPLRDETLRWLSVRRLREEADDRVGAAVAKRCLVGLYGRFGQRGWCWVYDGRVCPPGQYSTWWHQEEAGGAVVRCRAIAGRCWRQEPADPPAATQHALAGAITARGRAYATLIRDMAGPRGVLCCLTDGFIVTDDGLRRLRSLLDDGEGEPGRLRLLETGDEAVVVAAGAYCIGRRTGRMGYPAADGLYWTGWWRSGVMPDPLTQDGEVVEPVAVANRMLDGWSEAVTSARAFPGRWTDPPTRDLPPPFPVGSRSPSASSTLFLSTP